MIIHVHVSYLISTTFLLGLSVTNKKGKKILNIYFVYQLALKDGLADVTF